MKLYTSTTFSDEDGEAVSAKSAIVYGTKSEILELADFFKAVAARLKKSDSCHIHFSNFSKNWRKFFVEGNFTDKNTIKDKNVFGIELLRMYY